MILLGMLVVLERELFQVPINGIRILCRVSIKYMDNNTRRIKVCMGKNFYQK